MRVTHVRASNWRNFKALDFEISNRLFAVGPNASGKSNLLDLFRFLGDIAAAGGGLSAAMADRGGLSKVKSLFARNHDKGRLVLDVELSDGDDTWRYHLSIKGEGKGRNRPLVHEEIVEHNGATLLNRPDANDAADPELLTQTNLEQISANQKFRELAEYFAKVRYFHLVPQIIRDPGRVGAGSGDIFGTSFTADINAVPSRTRNAWLRRMEGALQAAVPEFESLALEVDPSGQPHLVAGYRNWRQSPTRQSEVDFSDGTLRLIGLLWTIVSAPANGGILLLEEPELSLNSAIVRNLASVLAMAQRDRSMQVILSTHSPDLLDDEGVLPSEILVLQPTDDGTVANILADIDEVAPMIAADLPKSDMIEALISPRDLSGLIEVGRRS
ncbi:MAG: AAA family ATPase [Corynebacterium sp.]|uniref:AAA family ATPase n=1 Tax=Corynebacterium TaxID=1716 RepID=UPI002649A5A4|nr:ATP-binding protein [Corynebacterium sp.]MDN5721901.1 AAA family ATPase [Corynebacterium sp.]MDN6281868.1 AAA family ATPase [Corynebacterium sp.]MDN6305080.1 AAA family ATPase [Corynebacterium sp.]MDN6351726.1 AAA family ATPase [Corynebacterium sp.]MDN6367256.1 AAA family ATPase [Corynebacterium sp.]